MYAPLRFSKDTLIGSPEHVFKRRFRGVATEDGLLRCARNDALGGNA